ncbi:MAG: DctP family TRAP transporter solute-binding subunit [Candidatus Latescibacterota bacterium]
MSFEEAGSSLNNVFFTRLFKIFFKVCMVKGQKFLVTVLLLLSAAFLLSCGKSSSKQEFKLSLILGTNSNWYLGAAKFKELVEARTEGKCHINIFPHGQLAGQVQRTELEMVQTGVIDMSLESSILLSLVEKRMSVLSMPWLFQSYSQADSILEGPLGRELLDLLPKKNLIGLAYGANGFRQITNNRNPIITPADLKGMKIRVPAIKMYIKVFKLLGADPSSMNFGELFTAIAQGTMDGQENPIAVIWSSRLYEVQKYLTLWDYSYDPIILCINKKRWESLSPEIQNVFMQCAREAMEYERAQVAGGEKAALDSLAAKGMKINTLTRESLVMFKALAEPIYKDYSRKIGDGLIERFRSQSGGGSHP